MIRKTRFDMREEPSMNFDTHKSIKFLIEKGIKESQAESIVEIVSRSRLYDFSKLATQDQLKFLEKSLKGEIKSVEEKLRGEIKSVENKLRGEIKSLEEKLRGEIKFLEEKLRGEIKFLEEKLRGEIKSVEERLRAEILSVKHEMLKWMLPFLIGTLLTVLAIFFKG